MARQRPLCRGSSRRRATRRSSSSRSYGTNFSVTFRRAAEQVAMILNGKKPAEMPVEQPTRFELVINMKTAAAIGVKIPNVVTLRADRLIE
jgi:putative tryptophan/tyrosine transport system substrate-binding protein